MADKIKVVSLPKLTEYDTQIKEYIDLKDTEVSESFTVTQELTEGIQIATVNGVPIYAPSYTDGDEVSY